MHDGAPREQRPADRREGGLRWRAGAAGLGFPPPAAREKPQVLEKLAVGGVARRKRVG
jgi:hypothetical protein